MDFSWPWALLTLLVLPLLLAAWWLTRRRRKRAAVRVTSIALVRSVAGGRSRWRRRVPAALFVLGLAVLAVGAARPQVSVPQPSNATIMLAMDLSGSMCSTDVKPNRITAAEQSAGAFIKAEAGGPRIGLVAFSDTAAVIVPPTKDTQQLLTALGALRIGGGTAIGDGIFTSLDAIAQVDPAVAPAGASVRRAAGAGYADDVIVVLTDGSNNLGVDPQVAAGEAAQRGVRVYTIGYGTDNPAPLSCGPGQVGAIRSGFVESGEGAGLAFEANYGALQQISNTTGGASFRAHDASQLSSALGKLPAAFTVVRKRVDIAAGFATLGGLLVAVAVALSLWQDRPRRDIARPRATLR